MKIMAVDYGDARTGLAACDRTEFLASPLGVIHEYNFERTIEQVAYAAEAYQIEKIVVGYPVNMDGSAGERAQKCALFAQKLQEKVQIPVILWDERGTTVTAHQYLNETNVKGKKRKEMVDEVAASIILESYLSYRQNHPDEK